MAMTGGKRLGALSLAAVVSVGTAPPASAKSPTTPDLESRSAPILVAGAMRYRDLDRNGALTPYEDWRLSPAKRARDLVSRMTLVEKAGLLTHSNLPTTDPTGMGSTYDFDAVRNAIEVQQIRTFSTRADGAPDVLADQHNRMQQLAEASRLGIPLTLSSDPRHHFFAVIGASNTARYFSQWPDAPGLAAIGDPKITRHFGDVARQEYRAIGLQMTLSPQADLASEPRWPRVSGTFGDDPEKVGQQTAAYIEGFQNGSSGLGRDSVVAVVKHWVGYGAAKEGYDSHNAYGRYADLNGGWLKDHIRPFEFAFRAHVGAVMPTYSILQGAKVEGTPVDQVGAGFSKALVTDLLRKRYRFRGVVLSDSAIVDDCTGTCLGEKGPVWPPIIAMPWGVEDLTRPQRAAKALNAGVDQILGLGEPSVIVEGVDKGLVAQDRIDAAAERVLEQKFALGLFENPYVDTSAAKRIVGAPAFRAAGLEAQRRSFVLLDSKSAWRPLGAGIKVFLSGVSTDEAKRRGLEVTTNLDEASLAIIRVNTPYQIKFPNYFISRFQRQGDLDFKAGAPATELISRAAAKVPVILDVNLERPAILTDVRDKASVLLVDFGASDEALFDVLMSPSAPKGRLPFELPSSMDAVRSQQSGAPHDSRNPLFPSGYRLTR